MQTCVNPILISFFPLRQRMFNIRLDIISFIEVLLRLYLLFRKRKKLDIILDGYGYSPKSENK